MLSRVPARIAQAVQPLRTVGVRFASTTDGSMLLAGKSVLVTGATSGIGWHAALNCAMAGANVLGCGRREERGRMLVEEITKRGGRAEFVVADMARPDECEMVVDATVRAFGAIDGAFNNAGVTMPRTPVEELTEEAMMAVFRVNVFGVLHCMKAQIKHMKNNENGGSIVNNSSIAGLSSASGWAAYAGSKHAVQAMTGAAASENAKHNIRVNTVNPGPIESEIWGSTFGEREGRRRANAIGRLMKMKRAGKGEEIGQPVVFLLSDAASYITGTSLTIDGGFLNIPYPDV